MIRPMEIQDKLQSCIEGLLDSPNPENIRRRITELGEFFQTGIDALAAEVDMIGSILERNMVEPHEASDPDAMLQRNLDLKKDLEQLKLENERLKKEKERLEQKASESRSADESEVRVRGLEAKLQQVKSEYEKENQRLKEILASIGNNGDGRIIETLNEQITALDLELDMALRALESKQAELESMVDDYKIAEFARAESEFALKRRIAMLEKETQMHFGGTGENPKRKGGHGQTIRGWPVRFNEEKESYYAERHLYGKLPLSVYVGKKLSPEIIERAVLKIRKQEEKHGLVAMPVGPNDLSIWTLEDMAVWNPDESPDES